MTYAKDDVNWVDLGSAFSLYSTVFAATAGALQGNADEETKQNALNLADSQALTLRSEFISCNISSINVKLASEYESGEAIQKYITSNDFNMYKLQVISKIKEKGGDYIVNLFKIGYLLAEANAKLHFSVASSIDKKEIEKTAKDLGFDKEIIDKIISDIRSGIKIVKKYLSLRVISETEIINGNNNDKIFIVHGHDESILSECKLFLKELNISYVILRELPDEGSTIIEKFEKYSKVKYAIVLLTPDDIGGKKGTAYMNLNGRGRQNVILELGFFLGRLGRDRVCVLNEKEVEIPSDYNGVLYVPIDKSSRWKLKLAQELQTAGFTIDINALFK